MRKSTLLLVGVLVILASIFGLQYVHRTFGWGPGILTIPETWLVKLGFPTDSQFFSSTQTTPTPEPTPTPEAKPQFGAIMAVSLSVSKAAVTEIGEPVNVASGSAAATVQLRQAFLDRLALIKEIQPTAVVLFGSTIGMVDAQIAIAEVKKVSPASLIMVDHEGGRVQRLSGEGFTKVPSLRQQCTMSEVELSALVASSAAELSMAGVDAIFGPVVDRNAGGSLGDRTCSDDPEKISSIAALYFNQFASLGMGVVLKHYPGTGAVVGDLHTAAYTVTTTEADIAPFFALQQSLRKPPIMVSFVKVAQVADIPTGNLPCALSTYCVGGLAKDYRGTPLISDALEMESAGAVPSEYIATFRSQLTATPSADLSASELSLSERSIIAAESGIDILLYGPSVTNADLRQVISDLNARYAAAAVVQEVTLPVRYNEAVQKIRSWNEARHAR